MPGWLAGAYALSVHRRQAGRSVVISRRVCRARVRPAFASLRAQLDASFDLLELYTSVLASTHAHAGAGAVGAHGVFARAHRCAVWHCAVPQAVPRLLSGANIFRVRDW